MIGSANATQTALTTAVSTSVTRMHMRKMRTALSRFCSPRRRATSAEIAVLIAIKTAMPRNFGCCVRPTAAIAYEPSTLTMIVSMKPTSATRNDSTIDGHATPTVSRRRLLTGGISPAAGSCRRMRAVLNNCTEIHPPQ